MKELTKKQYNSLKSVEDDLRRASKYAYKRGSTLKENELVFDVYDSITERTNARNYTCNSCVLNAFKVVGNAYFRFQDEMNKAIKELNTTTTETVVVKEVKRGRPKGKK